MTDPQSKPNRPSPLTVLREWGRIGCIGFGGPPTHIALLRELCVERRRWIDEHEFEDAIATTNLLPGPASTQMSIYCGWRAAGAVGALIGGVAFVMPGLLTIVGLAALFLGDPPTWVRALGAGAGAAVAAVAVQAGVGLLPASWRRARSSHAVLWAAYLLLGGIATVALGPALVLVLLGIGAFELLRRRVARGRGRDGLASLAPLAAAGGAATGGLAALTWVAFKVGALSYGGGFVIIPLMQADAVDRYGWMTSSEFLNAVALGQVTPGPVTHTVAVVGYAAAGVGGALLAALVAFAPSFLFIFGGARHFERLRANADVQAFLAGAGPAAIGAILGSAVPLALALEQTWQFGVLAAAGVLLLALRRGVVETLLLAAAAGVAASLAGAPIPA